MRNINKKIWKTFIMIALAQLLLICVSFVDNIMISHYDPEQVHFEAVGIGAEAWYIFQAFFLCLGIVFGILYSQFKSNKVLFGETFKFSLHITFVVMVISSLLMFFLAPTFVGVFYSNSSEHDAAGRDLAIHYMQILSLGNVFATFAYMILQPLQMTGKPKYSLFVAIVALISNFILDGIFIYICDLGAEGAAWATVVSFALQLGFAILFAWKNKDRYRFNSSLFKLDKWIVKLVFKRWYIYLSSLIMYTSYSTITMLLVAQYGSQYIKALTLAYMISGIMWTILIAVKQTTNIFVGKHLGMNDFEEAKVILKKLFRIFFLVNLVVSLIGFALAWWVPDVMLDDNFVAEKARWAIIIFACANGIYVFQTYYAAILESGGKQMFPNIFNYFAPFWTAVPMVIACGPWGAGMPFEWTFAIENASIGITVVILWVEVKKNKWTINLNKKQEVNNG